MTDLLILLFSRQSKFIRLAIGGL